MLVIWATLLDPLRRLDFWWHLKVGELILERGQIPSIDLFSFTEYGKAFSYPNWLAEVVFYLLWRVGGLELLVVFNTVVITTAFFIVYRTSLLSVISTRAVAMLMLVAALSFALYSNLRTQIFSFLFLALLLLVLWNYRIQRHAKLIWLIPLLMVVWVNVHGAYIIGLIVLGCFLISESVRYWLASPTKEQHNIVAPPALYRLAMVVALAFAATLVNPYGIDIYRYVQQVGSDPSSQLFVIEWQPPSITNPEHLLTFFLPFFSSILVFIYSHRHLDLTELGMFLFFSIFGLISVRNGIWFVIAVIPIAVWHLQYTPLYSILLRANQRETASQPLPWFALAINWSLLVGFVIMTILVSPWVRPQLGIAALRPSLIDPSIPVAAFEYIEKTGINGRMFHHQDFGDYMIWQLWPQQYTFIDGRVHLFSYDVVYDYLQALDGLNWERIMDKYNISYIFLPKTSDNSEENLVILQKIQHSTHWVLIYEDDKSMIFKRLTDN